MKLIKLTNDHYIIVDDSEIKIGDIVLETYIDGSKGLEHIQTLNDIDILLQKKVTHSNIGHLYQDSILPLSLQEVKKLIGEVDVEKKVKDYVEELIDCKSVKESERTWISAICYQMYNQALEDNKEKKYTESDLLMILQKTARKYFNEGREHKGNMAIAGDPLHGLRNELKQFIQSLQPKTEWEVEIVDGKFKLK